MDFLLRSNILTGCQTEPHEEVIRRCGAMLVASGYVTEHYVAGMLQRDKAFSTAIGNGIAIPHGGKEYTRFVRRSGLVVLAYPHGVPWNGDTVKLVIGIAAHGDEHIDFLERIADAFENEGRVDDLVRAGRIDRIHSILTLGKA